MTNLHNASHRMPPFFEWWYFQYVTPEGTAINLVLHETDIMGQKSDPYLSMSALLPGRSPCYLRRELQISAIACDRPFLRVEDPLIVEDEKGITFDTPFPGQGHFKGRITKLAPPLAFQDGILYQDISTGRSSYWVVQVPHAIFTAVLQLGTEIHHLNGMAYQDHQWGSTLLQASVADWVWGHFSNEHMAVLFFQILTQHGQLIERVAMMTEEGRFVGTAVGANYLDMLMRADHPEQFGGIAAVSFFNDQAHFAFTLKPENLMRRRLHEVYGQKTASYLRWTAAATYTGACEPQLLHGISEYIRIRPAMYGKPSS